MFSFHGDSGTLFLNRLLKVGAYVLLVGSINLFLDIEGLGNDLSNLIYHRFAVFADFPTCSLVTWDGGVRVQSIEVVKAAA